MCMNRFLRMTSLALYLFGGAVMWTLMLKSGVHATIAGILLAFAIPISAKQDAERSASHRPEHILHKPVDTCIIPIFDLANTGINIWPGWAKQLSSVSRLGILASLVRSEKGRVEKGWVNQGAFDGLELYKQ